MVGRQQLREYLLSLVHRAIHRVGQHGWYGWIAATPLTRVNTVKSNAL